LDGSDPTLWLKLACAARGLERIVAEKDNTSTIVLSKYRRLQRYALERGSQALPSNMPPNRTIRRALDELNTEPEPETYKPVLITEAEQIKLVLELPRYSWSMLGRMLVRACREGCDFQAEPRRHNNFDHRRKPSIQLGSPAIVLNFSPMLVLPSKVLGRICQFLENSSIWRFEATCRAFSVAIISARASMEEETTSDRRQPGQLSAGKSTERPESDVAQQPDAGKEEAPVESKEKAEIEPENDAESKTENEANRGAKSSQEPIQCHRTSKRLRSQLITSGKIAERSQKRKSFDFCFLAATLSCTKNKHRENMKELKGDKTISRLLQGHDMPSSPSKIKTGARNETRDSKDVNRREASERLGDSSLSAFVERWSGRNSGPMDLLSNYLVHVAVNVEDVFTSDPGGTVVLTSCILACRYK
jgi:hypothetical protein